MAFQLPDTRRSAWEFYAYVQKQSSIGKGPWATWKDAERWLGRADLFYLLVRLLRRPDLNKDWLFHRCREVQQASDGYLDLWAREHYKSTIITFGATIRDVLCDPEVTCGIFSHTRPTAKGFLVQIKREFEDNEWLRYLYNDVLYAEPAKQSPRWSEDGGIVVKRKGNPKESTIEAWGLVDGMPTGKHFALRVYDDVVTRESVTTPDMVRKVTDAWDLSQNLAASGDAGGRVRYIGTRYSLNDTYKTIIARGAARPRVYPATSNGRLDGVPVLFSEEEWAKRLRTSSRTILAAQMMQNPLADEDATFRTEWLRSYEVRPRVLNCYIMCDPSRGRSAESDNTAIAVVGIAAGGVKYFLDGVCHRMTLSQRWIALRNAYRKWSRVLGVQRIKVGYERYGAQSDDEHFAREMDADAARGIANAYFTIEELNWPRDDPSRSKRERVERLEPDFRNGRFLLPLPMWVEVTTDRGTKKGPATWTVETNPDAKDFGAVRYSSSQGLTKAQQKAIEGGSGQLVATAVRAVDQDNRPYDVVQHFIEEYQYFPFGESKDLIDATSRIYDMEPSAPILAGKELTEPPTFWDS